MASTTHNNASQEKKQPQPNEKRADLVCNVKYCNTLPDIPFDVKSLSISMLNPKRFIEYKPTSLERSYKYEILTERDLGVGIDLVNKDMYTIDHNVQMEAADEKLLEEDILVPKDSKRSKNHAKSVSWLKRTEYISTEQTRFQPQTNEKVEAEVGFGIKKKFKEETLYMDRDSQIKAIEKTFEDNKKPIEKHYSKPNVYAVETLNVFPDFKNWRYPCAQVIFDSDPAPMGRPVPAQIEEMSQAMIRGVMDESGEQFVAYCLPTEETIIKRREDVVNNRPYDDDHEYDYKMAGKYNWNVKNKSNKDYEENYFLTVRPDGIFYNELETRVRLSKRRPKSGEKSSSINTKLTVRHVPINEKDLTIHKLRETQLQPYDEEEVAKAVEAAKKAIIAAKGSAKEMATRNKNDSDDDIKKGDNKNTAGSDSNDIESNDSDDNVKPLDERGQRSTGEANSDISTVSSIKKSSSQKSDCHTPIKDSSGSDDSEKSDDENSTKNKNLSYSDDSAEENISERVKSEDGSDSETEVQSERSSGSAASVKSKSFSITSSDQESE